MSFTVAMVLLYAFNSGGFAVAGADALACGERRVGVFRLLAAGGYLVGALALGVAA